MIKITNLTNGILLLLDGTRLKRSETREFREDSNLLSECNKLFLEHKIQIEHIPDLSMPVELSALTITEDKKVTEPVKDVIKIMEKKSKFKRKW